MYTGPPPLTPHTALTSWQIDPTALAIILILGIGYLVGIRTLRARGRSWPWAWTAVFLGGGLGAIALATMSFLGVYAHVLFWTYAVQIITLLLFAPILLVLGRPLLLARSVHRTSERTPSRSSVWNSSLVRAVAYPPLATVVITAVPLLLFFTPWFEATLTRAVQYAALHVVLLATGFLFFWSNVAVDPLPRPFPRPVSTLLVFVETIVDALPGLILWLKATPIAAGYYLSVARPWGRSILDDQKLGGQLYWGIGELIGLPLLLIVALEWMRSDEREAARTDRRMDEERQARPDIETATQLETPWWITDPDRLGRGR